MITKIHNVRIITCSRDGVFESGTITFDESGVTEVSPHDCAGVKADVEINGRGMTVLPGLIDSHVHLGMDCSPDPFKQIGEDDVATTAYRAHQQGQTFLRSGITTVRNLGTRYNVDISYRTAMEQGMVTGPRVFAAGQPIVMTGGHGHVMATEVDGIEEVRKAARRQLKAGADLLKLMATGGVLTKGTDPGSTQFSEEELRCACVEAEHVSKTTAAHAIGIEGIKNAVRAGITTIEHGNTLDDEAVELMLEKGTYLVPTLMAATLIVDKKGTVPEHMIRKTEKLIQRHMESFRRAYQAGVKIAAGTDAGTPFNEPGLLVDELALMIEQGMTPHEAIQSATITAAQCVKADDHIGSLEKGKRSDLILVEGNPLEDIVCLKNIRKVYQDGTLLFAKDSERAETGEVN
ncbi:metal-dependent hydrolase family protein [Bacillus fonticola]|uniref:metal-dependent hydrolase family protein n=1 Tax=Bacillus fonticola TaxID=2728853 RepID=UPI001474876E|nr:amidohydrolase family protein [Bacillus fonticola]